MIENSIETVNLAVVILFIITSLVFIIANIIKNKNSIVGLISFMFSIVCYALVEYLWFFLIIIIPTMVYQCIIIYSLSLKNRKSKFIS